MQESANALFINGMDPVCKAIVQFHCKVNMEYEDLVCSLSILQDGERKVLELQRHFETRIVFGFAEKINFRSAGSTPHISTRDSCLVVSSISTCSRIGGVLRGY